MRRYLSVILAILLISCKNKTSPTLKAVSDPVVKDSSFMSLVPGAEKFDSAVILYYKDDRFRYYTYFPTDSVIIIGILKANLQTTRVTAANCPKEGTIYLYNSGEIFNTLYFNTTEGCRFLSFIFNGNLRRYELTEDLASALKNIKPHSIQPG